MATAIERLTSTVEAVLGRNVTNSLLLRVANRFCQHWQNEFLSSTENPKAPTNEEKAEFTLEKLRVFAQSIVRSAAESEAYSNAKPVVKEAGDTAATDLDNGTG